jgi:hypothetical protein
MWARALKPAVFAFRFSKLGATLTFLGTLAGEVCCAENGRYRKMKL